MKAYILLCDGFEEVEALATADILSRAGVEAVLVSPYGAEYVTGSHGINVRAGRGFSASDVYDAAEFGDADAVILPGGKLGTDHLRASTAVRDMILAYAAAGRLVAAICAAPTVLGAAGLLKNRRCTCYPGCEAGLGSEAVFVGGPAVTDGHIITGKSMGCSVDFALAIVTYLMGRECADRVEEGICRNYDL